MGTDFHRPFSAAYPRRSHASPSPQLFINTSMASAVAAASTAAAPVDVEDFGHEHDSFDPLLGRDVSKLHDEPVFPLIQRIRREIIVQIDTALSYDLLKQPTLNFSVVRPLTLKLSRGERPPSALIYALLVCRVHFLDVASEDLAFA